MPMRNSRDEPVAKALDPFQSQMLTARYRGILKDVIHTHILSGEPVSSRAISKLGRQRLSAATIRNVMADLEELGLLRQPHTSAGRVPTEAAYRLYVEGLMRLHQLPTEEKVYIEESLRDVAGDAEQLMSAVTHLLSELSHQVGLVVTPRVDEVVLKSADFVSIGGKRVLCVLVAQSGFVDHLVIETEEETSREDLVRISNYLTETFAGQRLGEIRDRLLQMMDDDRQHLDRWLARAIDLARQVVDDSATPEVLVEGTTTLLDQPELANLGQVRRMLDTFADKARLLKLLSQCLGQDGVRVVLGDESEVTSELDFSLVATTYSLGEGRRALGCLGIIGPSRMEYRRIVPLVSFLGGSLSRALVAKDQ